MIPQLNLVLPLNFLRVFPVIWEALEAAAECDLVYAQIILDSDSVQYPNGDMTLCIDDQVFRAYKAFSQVWKTKTLLHSQESNTVSLQLASEHLQERSFVMGCAKSSEADDQRPGGSNRLRRPRPWRHEGNTVSWIELHEMRTTFWQNAPRYGGRAVIWEALEAAAECDLVYAQRILDSNSIQYPNGDMTLCIDDRGVRYELPPYLFSEPTNMDRGPRNIIGRILRRR
ncbi:hypothetical protein LXL04_027411 [Taraxacum kok-saghyz]